MFHILLLVLACQFSHAFYIDEASEVDHHVKLDFSNTFNTSNLISDNDCDCVNGVCVKDSRGKYRCLCEENYALQDKGKCEKCNCGSKGKCLFVKSTEGQLTRYIKSCVCNAGTAEKDGTCVDCYCGNHSKCEFEDGVRVCYCLDGYADKMGSCEECDCGKYSKFCTFDENSLKSCFCKSGYIFDGDQCVDVCKYNGTEFCNDQNGLCVVKDNNPLEYYCRCREGQIFYQGLCQNKNGCEIEGDAKCRERKAFCKAIEKTPEYECVCPSSKVFGVDGVCREICYGDGDCHYGMKCEGRICSCQHGLSGDHCENIDSCQTKLKECVGDSGNCTFENGRAICNCILKDTALYNDKYCRECDCGKYSKFCTFDESSSKQCFCESGYKFDGDQCVDICQYEGNKLCTDQNALCFLNFSNPSDYYCRCREKQIFDHGICRDKNGCEIEGDAKCREQKAFCKALQKTHEYECVCPSTKAFGVDGVCREICNRDGDCHYGMKCEGRICSCQHGLSGDYCENIDSCETDLKECVGDKGNCTFENGRAVCNCVLKHTELYNDKYCRICDCGEGASCKFLNKIKTCDCLPGYKKKGYEEKCESVCTDNPCKNGGMCSIVGSSFQCECAQPYSGETCEEHPCDPNPCQNNGVCSLQKNQPRCTCPEHFGGEFCEKIEECRPDNCFGGKCMYNEFGDYVCVCPPGFHHEGFGCYETQCKAHHCYGGKCRVINDHELCTCLEGFTLINDVCERVKCKDKRCVGGKCNVVDGEEVCKCPEGLEIRDDVCRISVLFP